MVDLPGMLTLQTMPESDTSWHDAFWLVGTVKISQYAAVSWRPELFTFDILLESTNDLFAATSHIGNMVLALVPNSDTVDH